MISDYDLEERYLDVLQNIEFAIVSVFRKNPELTDHDVDLALEVLLKTYRGRSISPLSSSLTQEVFEAARGMCDWRLGRQVLEDTDGQSVEMAIESVSEDIILACLRRIRRSVRTWTKKGGRQGYLNYIDQFLV